AAQGARGTVTQIARFPAHVLLAAVCLGLAAANLFRGSVPMVLACAAAGALASAVVARPRRLVPLAVVLGLAGWWWGSARLDALDRSPLAARIGTAERARAVVTALPRRGRFDVRATAMVLRYGMLRVHEPVLLRLSLGRA